MLFLLIFYSIYWISIDAIKCHSCLTYCKTINGKVDPINCDCKSPAIEQCESNYCFVKIELFQEETTAIVQKGCLSDTPFEQSGCQYASNSDTLHCFCDRDQCNTRHELSNYLPQRLPTVECCLCTSNHGDDCERGCSNKCRGNYCVIDFEGKEQGCGLGYPRLPSFLRSQNYRSYRNNYLCSVYESSATHIMNGCVCSNSAGICNEINQTQKYQKSQVVKKQIVDMQYCYALMHKSYKKFGQDVYKRASTCEGNYCFVSLTTSEIVLESADFEHNYEDHVEFVGVSRPRFELQAGCIKVDDPKDVNIGCTVETQGNNSEIIAKHCICKDHLCNFHHLVQGTRDQRPKAETVKSKQHSSHSKTTTRLYTSDKIDENDILSTVTLTKISNSITLIYLFILFMLNMLMI